MPFDRSEAKRWPFLGCESDALIDALLTKRKEQDLATALCIGVREQLVSEDS